VNTELDRWFAMEILAHEAALTRYLRRIWRNAAEIPDFRQEVYIRVYESAAKGLPTAPKSFLFTTARNLVADRIRRERVVSIDYSQDLDALNVLVDEISPEQRVNARQELKRLAEAFDELSDECREAVWLRRVEGLSQKEAAQRLGVFESTLSSRLCRGLSALMKAVLGGDAAHEAQGTAKDSGHETEHG
jgi:RNA polymerase sigma-70 factor (ECF subfamily)